MKSFVFLQLLEALSFNGVAAQDFEIGNETIMTAKNGNERITTRDDGTTVTLIKNIDTSFNVKTDRD